MNIEEMNSLNFWNDIFNKRRLISREEIATDDWMQPFEKWTDDCKSVLDLGCGNGNDTKLLLEKGKLVTVCDQSQVAIETVSQLFPELQDAKCFHMPGVFPFEDHSFDMICADLSLHYFTEEDTFSILQEIKRILIPEGYLLIRVNTVNDVNHGAGEGEEVEPHLFRTPDGMLKRFFDEEDVKHFFSAFEILFCGEQDMLRYSLPKKVYTVCLRGKTYNTWR